MTLRQLISKFLPNAQGPIVMRLIGHRAYVGDMFEEIGQHVFNFLIQNNLKSGDILLDVGCGSLRVGKYTIPYLEAGHYLGLDKSKYLISKGLKTELSEKVVAEKHPEFVVSSNFEFHKFSQTPTIAIAHALFTQLSPEMIQMCLTNLAHFVKSQIPFFVHFNEVERSVENLRTSHDRIAFKYTIEELESIANNSGWRIEEHIKDWKHPRGGSMIKLLNIRQ
jgi:hypothetical protein